MSHADGCETQRKDLCMMKACCLLGFNFNKMLSCKMLIQVETVKRGKHFFSIDH